MIVQVYEIQTVAEAEAMIRLGVDHIGTVILSVEQSQNPDLKALVEKVKGSGRKSSLIPLFHDQEAVLATIKYYRPDIVHLCEALPRPGTPRFQDIIQQQIQIHACFPEIAIMRSIPIAVAGNSHLIPSLEWAEALESVSDLFLTDTLLTVSDMDIREIDQLDPGFVGITGQVCDWQVARMLVQNCRIPVILAGGIGPGNVAHGIQMVQPAGIDSCTLTNAEDVYGGAIRFKKDLRKVEELVQAVRLVQAEYEMPGFGTLSAPGAKKSV